MKLKKCLLTLGLIILYCGLLQAKNYLKVQNPQTWRSDRGSIEEAILAVSPQGLYMQHGLYLTFSAKNTIYNDHEMLEVVLEFELPEEAIVNDLWLWVGEDIMRAQILDTWTASEIYEDIVDRQKDPAILIKRDARQYELRIYPMKGNETRKIKLNYLLPGSWSESSVLSELPMNLLNTSKFPFNKFHLLYWPDENWLNPSIYEFPELEFVEHSEEEFPNYLRLDVPMEMVDQHLHLKVDAPWKNGVYLSKSPAEMDDYYQLALLPSKLLDFSVNKKVAFLFDYDITNSTYSVEDIIADARVQIEDSFTEADSFNLILSGSIIKRARESWFAATDNGIAQAFSAITNVTPASYSNLPSLLQNGIEFVTDNGNNGSILLFSNSDDLGDNRIADPLIDDLLGMMDPVLPIHILDYQNQNYHAYYSNGRSYYGNEYFYLTLSDNTDGYYLDVRDGSSLNYTMTEMFSAPSGYIPSFDLYTSLSSGFCYGRYELADENAGIFLNQPVLQVGKYSGSFPFEIRLSGLWEGKTFTQNYTVDNEQIVLSDTTIEEIWHGNYLQQMETDVQSQETINSIIDVSLDQRVLSLYTAFLALEPSDTVQPCIDCMDESDFIGTAITDDDVTEPDSVFIAYPNPFNSQTHIKISLPGVTNLAGVDMNIYSITGERIRNLNFDGSLTNSTLDLIWDGCNDGGLSVASGTYFFILKTDQRHYSLKLLYLK